MSNEAVEYVRGVPVVKTFGQTVFSFHRFKASIDDYCDFCMPITGKLSYSFQASDCHKRFLIIRPQ
jgi:ATP-binding cassette subfamily B protein